MDKLKGLLGETVAQLERFIKDFEEKCPDDMKPILAKAQEEINVMIEKKDPSKFMNIKTLINNARHQHNKQKSL